MRLSMAVQSTVSAKRVRHLLILFAGLSVFMALTACGAVSPIDDENAPSRESDRTVAPASSETETDLSRQVVNTLPLTESDIDPDEIYEWAGLIEWVELEGGHFVVNRGCDRWSLATESEETEAKLKELTGGRAIVLGAVGDASIYGRRTVNVARVYGPGEPRPEIAMRQLPCPSDPAPADAMTLNHSEITLHGDLIWRAGNFWLLTDRGRVALKMSDANLDIPDQAAPEPGDESTTPFSLGEYGVVGMWSLADSGLVIEVREIREWRFPNVVFDSCGDGKHVFGVGDGQLAAHGSLIRDDSQWTLRTKSGEIYVLPGFDATDLALASEPLDTDADAAVAPDVPSIVHQVVVIGPWKTDGVELHMEAEKFIRIKSVCDEPPQPPRTPIFPGEIAAPGRLYFEDGQPFLQTPQGRITLLIADENTDAEEQAIPGNALKELLPQRPGGPVEGDGVIARPVRQVLVVGKWQVSESGELAISVRYAVPWPAAGDTDVTPAPPPEPPAPTPGARRQGDIGGDYERARAFQSGRG